MWYSLQATPHHYVCLSGQEEITQTYKNQDQDKENGPDLLFRYPTTSSTNQHADYYLLSFFFFFFHCNSQIRSVYLD